MEMLLSPLDVQYGKNATAPSVRLPSLFSTPSPVRTLGMSDVLSATHPRSVSPLPSITRLPSIGSIMRRDETSPCASPKCDAQAQSMSPLQKQTGHQIYRQLQSPPSDSALKNMLAGAALSKLSQMSAVTDYIMNEVTDSEGAYEANDRNKRSNSAKLCGMQDCKKRAKAGGYCIAHGGGLRCAEKGCQKHAVSLGLCISHGGGKRCTVEGCLNASRKNGVCWSHGGKRLCKLEGCNKGPKSGGYCWSHGGKMKK
jgi:hypothetical protein